MLLREPLNTQRQHLKKVKSMFIDTLRLTKRFYSRRHSPSRPPALPSSPRRHADICLLAFTSVHAAIFHPSSWHSCATTCKVNRAEAGGVENAFLPLPPFFFVFSSDRREALNCVQLTAADWMSVCVCVCAPYLPQMKTLPQPRAVKINGCVMHACHRM